jgi:hypothetical protein
MHDNFGWQPLAHPNSFRILHIDPAEQHDAPLRAHLTEHPLNNPAPYIALSYHWGPAVRRHPVALSNAALNRPDSVAVNGQRLIHDQLNLALRSIRSTQHVVDLWTDGLCINQDDVRERADQVLRMTTIYSHASEVVVYLGDSFPRGLDFDFQEILSTLCDYSPRLKETAEAEVEASNGYLREVMTWWKRGRSASSPPAYAKPKPREGDFLELQGPLDDFVVEMFGVDEGRKHVFLVAADRFFSLPW